MDKILKIHNGLYMAISIVLEAIGMDIRDLLLTNAHLYKGENITSQEVER